MPGVALETWYERPNTALSVSVGPSGIRALYLRQESYGEYGEIRHAVPEITVNVIAKDETRDAKQTEFMLLNGLVQRSLPEHNLIRRSFVTLLLDLAADILESAWMEEGKVAKGKSEWTWQRVTAYIEENHPYEISRSTAAADLKIHPSHLSRIFRERGTTYSKYVRDLRLLAVESYLCESPELTVSEIAFNTGFRNLSYFFSLFRKRTGMTPQQWRSSHTSS